VLLKTDTLIVRVHNNHYGIVYTIVLNGITRDVTRKWFMSKIKTEVKRSSELTGVISGNPVIGITDDRVTGPMVDTICTACKAVTSASLHYMRNKKLLCKSCQRKGRTVISKKVKYKPGVILPNGATIEKIAFKDYKGYRQKIAFIDGKWEPLQAYLKKHKIETETTYDKLSRTLGLEFIRTHKGEKRYRYIKLPDSPFVWKLPVYLIKEDKVKKKNGRIVVDVGSSYVPERITYEEYLKRVCNDS